MPSVDYTVVYSSDEGSYDLCRIILGDDGSYYVAAPYHPLDKALLAKWTVNYAQGPMSFTTRKAIEVGVLDDGERRLKLSHHPDGFLQFSGEGVRSGREPDGTIRGLGLQSWPLDRPTFGPSFALAFSDPHKTGRRSKGGPRSVVFAEDDINHMRASGVTGLRIVGYYFPVPWREYVVRDARGQYEIGIINPSAQAVLNLKVILGSKESKRPALIGLQAVPHTLLAPSDPAFALMSSTGNVRRNRQGELLGDQLVCFYPIRPEDDKAGFPSLNYPLPALPYVAPRHLQLRRLVRALFRLLRS